MKQNNKGGTVDIDRLLSRVGAFINVLYRIDRDAVDAFQILPIKKKREIMGATDAPEKRTQDEINADCENRARKFATNLTDAEKKKAHEQAERKLNEEINANTLRRWNAINDAPFEKTDLTPLDDAGRKMMERVRREYRAPTAKYSSKRGGVYTIAVNIPPEFAKNIIDRKLFGVCPNGGTTYKRAPNVWDDLRDWIDSQWEWCDAHDVDAVKIWGDINGVRDIEILLDFKQPTPAIAERMIAECVAAYQRAHKQADGGAANAEVLAMLKEMRGDMKDVKRDTARLAGERETERERRSAAAKKGHAANRDKVHDDEIAAALAKVHEHAGDDKAKIAHWCDKVIHDDGLQVRGRGGVYKPMTRATLMRYYRTWRKTHGGT